MAEGPHIVVMRRFTLLMYCAVQDGKVRYVNCCVRTFGTGISMQRYERVSFQEQRDEYYLEAPDEQLGLG